MHRIELDSVKRHRNAHEWRMVQRARCGDLESVGDGQNIKSVARLMLQAGMVGPVAVYRGKTPVFLSGTVEQWASGKFGKGEQPAQLRKERADA